MNQKDPMKKHEFCDKNIRWAKEFKILVEAWEKCNDYNDMFWAFQNFKPLTREQGRALLKKFVKLALQHNKTNSEVEYWAGCAHNSNDDVDIAFYAWNAACAADAEFGDEKLKKAICDIIRKTVNPFKQWIEKAYRN